MHRANVRQICGNAKEAGLVFRFPKLLQPMTLKSALEDLQENTLTAVAGILGKLEYFSALRDSAGAGAYGHWGLTRTHGDPAAQRALAEAHRSLLSHLLRTPLSKLLEDVDGCSRHKGVSAGVYLEELRVRGASLLPPAPGAGSAHHLDSVIHALSSLTATQPPAIPPAS